MTVHPLGLTLALLVGGSTLALAQDAKRPERPEPPSAQKTDPGQTARPAQTDSGRASPGQADQQDRGTKRAERGGSAEPKSQPNKKDAKPAQRTEGQAGRDERKDNKTVQGNRSEAQNSRHESDRNEPTDRAKSSSQSTARGSDGANGDAKKSGEKADSQLTSKRARDASGPREEKATAGEAPKLSDAQQRRVRDEFRQNRAKVRHYTNVKTDISIGRRAPRDWTYYAVPSFIIDIAPRYRDYRYAWIGDRYVIIDPNTYEIIAYIDEDSGRLYASGGSNFCTAMALTPKQNRRIVAAIDVRNRHDVSGIRVGLDIPGRIELRSMPRSIGRDFERLSDCRYIALSDGRIALVQPRTREVVAIISR